MKRLYISILIIVTIYLSTYNVNAKDTLYSINKYKEENLDFIEQSYNKKGKEDGYVVAGEFLKEEIAESPEEKKEYHPILIKYDKEGKKIWEFSSKEILENNIDYLTYSYDETGNINGYLIITNKKIIETNEESGEETTRNVSLFTNVNLDGKQTLEKEISIENYSSINKILACYNDSSSFDGYILIATLQTNQNKSATLIRLDKELNISWQKNQITEEGKDTLYQDITNIWEENKIIGYAAIETVTQNSKPVSKLVRFDKEGNKEVILESLEEYYSCNLSEANNGFILYGLTSNVKVNAGKYSYYLVNYDSANNEVWESIGDIGISNKEKIKLLPIREKDNITKYLFLYQNSKDLSKEVIELDLDGLLKKKIKKISNDYYHINEFTSNGEILYFVGYITCPEEDNCNYDTHSLFLISDEDKVIEVEPKTANGISMVTLGIVCLIILIVFIKKKKRD